MDWANDDNAVERAVDIAAAAVFAASIGFAAGAAGISAPATISAAVAASLVAFAVLKRVSVGQRLYDLPAFEPVLLELAQEAGDELLLDDRLVSVPPDSRIIRLFDPALESGSVARSNSSPSDASQALTEALAELRRSLR